MVSPGRIRGFRGPRAPWEQLKKIGDPGGLEGVLLGIVKENQPFRGSWGYPPEVVRGMSDFSKLVR
jgi:hypothetical protein